MKLERWQFGIQPTGRGMYKVYYYTRGRCGYSLHKFCALVTDMELIDAVKHVDRPSQKALKALYSYLKNKQLNNKKS